MIRATVAALAVWAVVTLAAFVALVHACSYGELGVEE